jgi:hypothetical protein
MLSRWILVAVAAVTLVAFAGHAKDAHATSANITQACSAAKPGTSTVTWVWPGPGAGAQQTWFDISLVPGFLPGWFQGYGPMPASQTAFAMDGLPQGLTFYYRVNSFYGSGWYETASGSFVSNCGGGGGSTGGAPVTGDVSQVCAGNTVTVTFKWQANASGPQYIDLTVFNNGFAPGTFVGAGPIGSGGGSFTWYGIAKGVTHFWRVNTLTSSGWMGSNTGSFTSLSCLPPEKACVGYMAGYSASGKAECDQLMSGPNAALGNCVRYILKIPVNDGKTACVTAAVSAGGYLSDCLLGLSGQSHFGLTSCRIYYQS